MVSGISLFCPKKELRNIEFLVILHFSILPFYRSIFFLIYLYNPRRIAYHDSRKVTRKAPVAAWEKDVAMVLGLGLLMCLLDLIVFSCLVYSYNFRVYLSLGASSIEI